MRGWLQESPGGEGEPPREGKAHEGRGSRYGLNYRPGERTFAGSKALKWGLQTKGAVLLMCCVAEEVEPWKTSEAAQDGMATGRQVNHKRATAPERARGSASGMNPGG
jgi:hypothetical protein